MICPICSTPNCKVHTLFGIPEPPDPPGVDPHVPQNPDRDNLRRKASEWAQDNLRAYQWLANRCFELIRQGFKRLSINRLMEELRDARIDMSADKRGFKLNNNHRPYIARKLVADYPELAPYFRFRVTNY